ncbi:hypothetical protein Ccel01_19420 [Cellulosimicrobium cellulans]|uniref:Uncharacterized protein n=1 Tax=Cellulosimicrobium cellulans TaxID=1710 RepID=A0AAV5P5S2_CELCE|nr:hypothetical protein Ccel01_19420 [Cellulosimicrobium cellulans]
MPDGVGSAGADGVPDGGACGAEAGRVRYQATAATAASAVTTATTIQVVRARAVTGDTSDATVARRPRRGPSRAIPRPPGGMTDVTTGFAS